MFANHEDQGHLSVTQNWQFRSVDQDLDGHRHFSREAVIENSKQSLDSRQLAKKKTPCDWQTTYSDNHVVKKC